MIQSIHASTAHSVRLICETLDLPRSSYHHAARPCARQLSDAELGPCIETVFRQHQRRYGYRRIYHLLRQEGVILSPDRVRRLMREAGYLDEIGMVAARAERLEIALSLIHISEPTRPY